MLPVLCTGGDDIYNVCSGVLIHVITCGGIPEVSPGNMVIQHSACAYTVKGKNGGFCGYSR